jgi:hypothetical protein
MYDDMTTARRDGREDLLRHTYIHTYHSRFIPEGVAEASRIFPRHTRFTKIAQL